MNNARFATALHILTLLEHSGEERLSSEYIAGSINLNPALVRKEISNLRKLGFISSREGNGGGFSLARPADQITLGEIYRAVRSSSVFGRTNNPNPACTVGKQINTQLEVLYKDAEQALTDNLAKQTLAGFSTKFNSVT